jgi:hypothetical protein
MNASTPPVRLVRSRSRPPRPAPKPKALRVSTTLLIRLNQSVREPCGRALFKRTRQSLRAIHDRWLIRLPDREFKLLSAVQSRTLGWDKYVDRITTAHLAHGLIRNGEYVEAEGSNPIACLPAFAGTGIGERDLRARGQDERPAPLAWLYDHGLITSFDGPHGNQFMYATPGILKACAAHHHHNYDRVAEQASGSVRDKWDAAFARLVVTLDALIEIDEAHRPRPFMLAHLDLEALILNPDHYIVAA